MAIEIVDLPIQMVIFYTYVTLPEGRPRASAARPSACDLGELPKKGRGAQEF